MSQLETEVSLDDKPLSELYRVHGVSWEKLLKKLGLPTDAGITKFMTFGQAKALAGQKPLPTAVQPIAKQQVQVSDFMTLA